MCKNVVIVPMKKTGDAAMQKSCKPAMFGRMWHASRRALNLEHSPPHQFACCQWQKNQQYPSTAYLLYRWLLFIFVVSVGIASFSCQRLPPNYDGPKIQLNYFKWFIYFTNWGFLLLVLQAGLAVAVVHRYRAEKYDIPCEEDEMAIPVGRRLRTPHLYRAYWLTHIIATDLAFVISLVYWALVHDPTCEEDEMAIPVGRRLRTPHLYRAYWLTHIIATDLAFVISLVYWALVHDPKIHEVNTLNVLVHGCNSLLMLVELAVTAHPIRAAHALYSAGAGLAYGVFSAFYWAVGGTDRIGQPAIYPTLNWSKPGSAFGFVALCAVVLVCAHALATCCAAARIRLARRLNAGRQRVGDRLTLPTH